MQMTQLLTIPNQMSVQSNNPVLFLDVDGVLNSSLDCCPWPDVETSIVKHPDVYFALRIVHSKALGAALNNLDIEIRWLTTWGVQANKLISPLYGLPTNLKVEASPEDFIHLNEDLNLYLSTVDVDWKFEAIKRFAEREAKPFIWIDDEAIAGKEEALASIAEDIKYMEIQPVDEVGLMQTDIDRIAKFIGTL